MECWSHPPAYDDAYVPPHDSRYWFPERETMPAGERERAILARMQVVYHLTSLEDFEAKVPVIANHGENVYPSEIDDAFNDTPGYGGEHQIVITREAAMDELLSRIESNLEPADMRDHFRTDVARRVQTMLGLRTRAEIVPSGSLPRTDFKARRVIDDRAVFRESYAQNCADGE